ncbi:capsular exopolysaccharide family [Paenibacillus sophorae]|uniref:non-specific protein-tyrosine kinase n=1 Tax=Paenibacillus sophorae TaxID=1333845 RepID=A0A1H8QH97_9BACL|nr:CpsD/CapB family tyrosine-protein kinase [Paenibacillus sophorae]QWU15131.1 CpsD/CapB family tyrosine-protein kinase [Paenibacillus sophorae]SEO53287.1 capsular exopolysaccharide family [Paenibacillus sophorae]
MSQLQNKQRHLITVTNPRSTVSEAFRALRTNIDFSSIDEKIQVIMVTSSGPEEGKSTVTGNLAVAYAQADKKVVLIDADLRKPTGHRTFSLSNRFGLSSLLSQQANLDEVIQVSGVPNLSIITSGPIPPNPAEMIASNRMSATLQELRQRFDIILIDTPPLLAVTDAQIMSSKSDGVIMVVSYGKVKRDIAVKAKASLDRVGARMLGVVMNNVKRKASEGSYYYYYGN